MTSMIIVSIRQKLANKLRQLADYLAQSEDFFDERSVQSAHSSVQDDEETVHRTSSSLNNYCILPPIKSTTKENDSQQPDFIKQLQDKYQSEKNSLQRN